MADQNTDAWMAERCGRITASMMHAVMAFTASEGEWKSGPRKGQPKVAEPLKARKDYIRTLVAERLTGKSRNGAKSKSMDHGKLMEPRAIEAYEIHTGELVERVGFIVHPQYSFIGASPDFFVGEGGGEVKCPFDQEVHLETIETGLPEEHIEQINGGLWVTGRKFWDFVSYHEDFPEHLRLYVQRIKRDEVYISKLEQNCLSLEAEVRVRVNELKGKLGAEKKDAETA